MAPRDIPIIFSAPMIRALLDGRKTMTRRLAWQKPHKAALDGCDFASEQLEDFELRGWNVEHRGQMTYVSRPTTWQRVKPSDRLWVRETFATPYKRTENNPGAIYRADGPEYLSPANRAHQWGAGERWTSPIHMPRWASRLTLIVTATKIERLNNITADDAKAEGVPGPCPMTGVHIPQMQFATLWRSLHGPESWNANPEVVALTFAVHKQNIDQLTKDAA